MMTLIVGGSGSGKSAYAEEYLTERSEDSIKYYIATMQVFDQEGRNKIKRHRQMRSGKDFITIEQPRHIEEALGKMKQQSGKKTALLECISNLTANEMFKNGEICKCEEVVEKIVAGIQQLAEGVNHLVIVTNNVFEDGQVYDETTMEYIRAMGDINRRLACLANQVVEVVVGIPVCIKEMR